MAINSPLSEDITEVKVRQTWKKVRQKFIKGSEL
jgi:hypothetical protein